MKKKLILAGLALFTLITAGLLYRFYPYFLYKKMDFAQVQARPDKEPTQPLSLTDYQNYLITLDRANPSAVASGIRVLELSIPHFSVNEADQSFLAFNTYYVEALNHCNETFWQNDRLVAKLRTGTQGLSASKIHEYLNKPSSLQKDPEIQKLVQQTNSSGFILMIHQGSFYFDENSDFLYNRFSKYLSVSLRDFLDLRRREKAEGFMEDAELQISFTKIGERIIDWETYLNKYPDSPLKELAIYHYQLYLSAFLFGIDDTKAFERKRLKPEIIKVYEDFQLRFAKTRSANLISRYYKVLRTNDFKYTKAAEKFLYDNQIQILPGFEP